MPKMRYPDRAPTEFLASSVSAAHKDVNRCKRYNRHVMISFTTDDSNDFYDLFLSQGQAEFLQRRLLNVIQWNRSDRKPGIRHHIKKKHNLKKFYNVRKETRTDMG
jgi:hypothetical protein